MIINSSQIRMDASTGHKDVSITGTGQILNRNHQGRREEHFNLDLPDAAILNGQQTSSRLHATQQGSSVVTQDNQIPQISENGSVISKILSEIVGEKTEKTRRFILQRPGNQQEGPPAPFQAGKRFYNVGGQPFSMVFAGAKSQYEHEFVEFSSSGTVNVADGRTIDFSFNMSLERTTVVHESILAQSISGYLVDPLVLHFDGGLETLSEESFLFDITGDGEKELIPGLQQGSGFLALDLDGDAMITSGKELFGPTSGSGFADLAIYDTDDNDWIDENDPIFSQLTVWMNASGGQQELLSLKEAGVGAISLSNMGTLFNLKTSSNVLLGQVEASGIFLMENGEVKSLQDINVAVAGTDSSSRDEGGKRDGSDKNVINEAIMASRSIIMAQRSRGAMLARRQQIGSMEEENSNSLNDRFWKWQEMNQSTSQG